MSKPINNAMAEEEKEQLIIIEHALKVIINAL